MRTKELTEVAHRSIVQKQNMRLPFTKVQLKHLSVSAGLGSIAFDNGSTGGQLPDFVVMEMITDDEFASGNHTASPFNFQHFNVSRVEMKKNGTTYPRGGYTFNWADGHYINDYIKFQGQLGYDTGNNCVQLTPHE